MFTLAICLVFIILRAEANDPETGAVILTANGQISTYVTTNLSVNYDGEVNYAYEDGEDFSISCKKAEDNSRQDTLRLEYYNAEGILLFQTKPRAKQLHMFRSILKSNNDKYYLDCIRAARDPETEYRYRLTTFFKRDLHADAVQHAVILSVNGQKLSTFLNNDKLYDDYVFRYIDGEVLNVTCRKTNVNMRGSLTFYSIALANPITNQTLRSHSPSEAVILLNTSTSDVKKKYLICGINNTDVEKPYARLLFLSDVPNNGVRIRGLPRNNVLYEYTNDEDQWTTEYQYSVNDTLNLSCVSNEGFHFSSRPSPFANPFQWKFENKTFDSAAIGTSSTRIKVSEIPFTKILKATHNGTIIKCIYFPNVAYSYINKTAEIILRLKSEAKRDEDTSAEWSTNTLVYSCTIGVSVIIVLVMIYWIVNKSCCCCIMTNSRRLPPVPMPRRHPDTVFYLNLLSVFQEINEHEAAQLERHYEEVQ